MLFNVQQSFKSSVELHFLLLSMSQVVSDMLDTKANASYSDVSIQDPIILTITAEFDFTPRWYM